jgi:PAS domain-containing protein
VSRRAKKFKFRLYVAGDAQNSAQAVTNLTALCRAYLRNRHDIEVVNVFREPKRALADGILMTPTLVKLSPTPAPRGSSARSARGSRCCRRWGWKPSLDEPFEVTCAAGRQPGSGRADRDLHETGQRLEELTAGEVDTVADRDGRTFVLRRAQEQLRHAEAAKQAAILNALPAHIALLDERGTILSVNETWAQFVCGDVLHGPAHTVGLNYFEICGKGPRQRRIRGAPGGRGHSFGAGRPEQELFDRIHLRGARGTAVVPGDGDAFAW